MKNNIIIFISKIESCIYSHFKFLIKILIIALSLIFFLKILIFVEKYKYCYKCYKLYKKFNLKCSECPNQILFKNLYIESEEKTLNEIIKNNKSISRYGDGEFNLIIGKGIFFQKYDIILSKRLLEVLNSNENKLLIGIFIPKNKNGLETFSDYSAGFWKNWFRNKRFYLSKILKKKKYYSSLITRFYSHLKDKSNVGKYIKKLKKIWEGREILIIEGKKTRFGIGNDFLNNAKSIKRIICPSKNSFRVYDKILNATLKFDKNTLILISLGPTATVLAYDLTKFGYQTIDIGHANVQYELYLRNMKGFIPFQYNNTNIYKGKNENNGGIFDRNLIIT